MNQHLFTRNYFTIIAAVAIAAMSFTSCSDGGDGGTTGGTTPVKCIDNKPAPTPFATELNAINHTITLEQAQSMINNFGVVRESMLATAFTGRNVLPVSETFNLKAIDALLCQPNAVGFRVYMAMDGQQQVRFVLVGVDGDGKDIIQRSNETPGFTIESATGVSTQVYEAGQRWP